MKHMLAITILTWILTGCASPTIKEIRGDAKERTDVSVNGNYEAIARCVRDAFAATTTYGLAALFGHNDVSVAIFPESGVAEVIPTMTNGAIQAIYEIRKTQTPERSAVTIYLPKSHGSVTMLTPHKIESYADIALKCGE